MKALPLHFPPIGRPAVLFLVMIEGAALIAFFYSVRVADSYLPELGGTGDGTAIGLWSARATFAFFTLGRLWVTAVGTAVCLSIRSGWSLGQAVSSTQRGLSALAVAVPPVGLIVGYLVMAFGRW